MDDIPNRLWAATSLRVPAPEHFRSFGKLRNGIQHFSAPEHVDLHTETSKFVFEVVPIHREEMQRRIDEARSITTRADDNDLARRR
jgi:hypothetical protein